MQNTQYIATTDKLEFFAIACKVAHRKFIRDHKLKETNIMLSDIERKILYTAQFYPTWSRKQMALMLRISASHMSKVWAELKSRGVIKGVDVLLDPQKCGVEVLGFIEVYFPTHNLCKQGLETLTYNSMVQEIHALQRGDALFLKVRARTTADLVDFKLFLSEIGGSEISVIPTLWTYKETGRLPL